VWLGLAQYAAFMLAILIAIRRAYSDLILIKLPIGPLWFKSRRICAPLGAAKY
jgi:hypothetical protein